MTNIPFLTHNEPDDIVATRSGAALTRARMIGDMRALEAILRPARYVLNVCVDRYNFALGVGAALMRGQITLLPPNDAPVTLAQLAETYGDLYILADRERADLPAPVLAVPERLASTPARDVPAFPPTRDAIVLFTSGSTGRPQPHAKTWGALVASTRAAGLASKAATLKGARVFATVPLQHSYGFESAVMLALQHGLVLDTRRPFYPADIAAALESEPGKRVLVTTPLHLRALLRDVSTVPRADLVLSATAPLASDLARTAEAAFGCPLIEIYGCSEAGQVAWRRTAWEAAWETIAGLALRQADEHTYVSGAPIVPHEIILQDVITLETPTQFYLHGRTGDLVNIAGKRSSLAHLNAHLNAIDGVEDGAFVSPQDDPQGTGRLIAFVVAPGVSSQTILTALRQRLDPAFLPRRLVFVDALPRNALGKLPSEALRRLVEKTDVT